MRRPSFVLLHCVLVMVSLLPGTGPRGLVLAAEDAVALEQDLQALAASPAWLRLMYYQPRGGGRYSSEVDDDAYFLSNVGHEDPLAELQATLQAWGDTRPGDDNPRCRFPARYHWLAQVLEPPAQLAPIACGAFEAFRDQVAAESVSLIFPAAHMDSPSSMFGHSLIKLNQANSPYHNDLLDYTVSYAAREFANESQLGFIYRALAGGYPGLTSVQGYYQKLKQYGDIESRDIWEYQLNYDRAETAQLVRHIWEIRDVNFNYYFFRENCSYRVLALLDVLRPGQPLVDDYFYHVIPIDSVRQMIDRGWVVDTRYRPSVRTRIAFERAQLSAHDEDVVLDLVRRQQPVSSVDLPSDAVARVNVLDLAYEYSRVVDPDMVEDPAALGKVSHRLLLARQQEQADNSFGEPPRPAISDDQGHRSMRAGLFYGEREGRAFVDISLRPAYHDTTDIGAGYTQGANLNFLRLDVRVYVDGDGGSGDGGDSGEVDVQSFELIGLQSLKPRDDFFRSLSWSFSLGAERRALPGDAKGDDHLLPEVTGYLGPTWKLGASLLYALVGGEARIDSDIYKNIDALVSGRLGLLYYSPDERFQVQWEYRYADSVVSSWQTEQGLELSASYGLSRNTAISLHWQQQEGPERWEQSARLGVYRYF